MRSRLVITAASALTVIAAAVPAGAAAAAPQPGITVLNVNGSGCRKNTTAVALSPDRSAITITYSDYVVAPAGATGTVSKDCRINLKVEPPAGYAPVITSVDYRGFVDVAAGSVAQLQAGYGFHGATRIDSLASRQNGPFSDYWQATDDGVATGRCKGSNVFDLDSTLTLTSGPAGAASDLAAMDSTDGVAPNVFHVAWSRCA